jgi:hypothetical protein
MRILITGDRSWACHELAAAVIRRLVARYGPDITIVHGDAAGVDKSFATAAEDLGVAVEAHPADWSRLGKSAGPIRNREMVQAGADLCIAFHRFIMASKGTKNCATQDIEAGIPTYLIDSEQALPKRLLPGDPRLE